MSREKFEIFYSELRVEIWCARRAGTFLRKKPSPKGGSHSNKKASVFAGTQTLF